MFYFSILCGKNTIAWESIFFYFGKIII